MPNRIAVSCAEFIRNIGYWQSEAARRPVSITHHGRERLVLCAPEEFAARRADFTEVSATPEHAAILDNADEGYLRLDAQLRICASNARARAFVGRAEADLTGATALEVMPQPAASVLSQRLQRVVLSRKPERFEASAFDGRQLSLCVFPVADGAGVLFQNLTELHSLRRRLEDAEALGLSVGTHRLAATIRLDARARVQAICEVFTTWSGFAARDIFGHRFVDVVHLSDRRCVGEAIERALREGAPAECDVTLLAKHGQEVACLATVAPVLTDFVAHGVLMLCIAKRGMPAGQAREANAGAMT